MRSNYVSGADATYGADIRVAIWQLWALGKSTPIKEKRKEVTAGRIEQYFL
jgi:hypothetical protein